MMDDGDDSELTMSPSLRGTLPTVKRRHSLEDSMSDDTETEDLGVLDGQEADQMEWDPQMDGLSPVLVSVRAHASACCMLCVDQSSDVTAACILDICAWWLFRDL